MRASPPSNRSLPIVGLSLGILVILLFIIRIDIFLCYRGKQFLRTKLEEESMDTSTTISSPKRIALVMMDYVRPYTLREAYESADLVILGRIIYTEYYVWSIKRPYKGKTLTFEKPYIYHRVKVIEVFKGNPASDIVIVAQFGGLTSRGLVIVPEDPPMKEGELVILFLKGPSEKGDFIKYPGIEYRYMSAFGRFKVINGKLYSAMYFLPEEMYGIPCRRIAENLLKDLAGYKEVNGITVDDFLKLIGIDRVKTLRSNEFLERL